MAGRTLRKGPAARAFTLIRSRTAMTREEKKTLAEMCERIQEEQEPIEFQRLVVELLDLLEEVAPKKRAASRAN